MTFGRRKQPPRRSPRHWTGLEPAGAAVFAPSLQPAAQPGPADDLRHSANAAADIVAMLLAAYTLQDRLQAESAIAAAAALTGEFALRSTGLPLPDKGMVPGDATNDVLFAGGPEGRATAWMFMMHAAIGAGVAEYELPRIEDIAARVREIDAIPAFPPLSVPEKHFPHEWPANVGPRFRHRIIAIADTHDLSLREVTIALAAAVGQLIIRAQQELPPLIGATLAAEIMVAVARMVPLAEPVA